MYFEEIKSFSRMTLSQRYNLLLATVIVVQSFVAIKMYNDIQTVRDKKNAEIAILQAKLDKANSEILIYFQNSDKELKDLLKESKRLKEKIDEISD